MTTYTTNFFICTCPNGYTGIFRLDKKKNQKNRIIYLIGYTCSSPI